MLFLHEIEVSTMAQYRFITIFIFCGGVVLQGKVCGSLLMEMSMTGNGKTTNRMAMACGPTTMAPRWLATGAREHSRKPLSDRF